MCAYHQLQVVQATARSKVVVLLLLTWLISAPIVSGMFVPCFVMQYFVSFLVLQLSCWVRESWLLYFYRLLGVLWLLLFFCLFVMVPWVSRSIFWSCSLTFYVIINDYYLEQRKHSHLDFLHIVDVAKLTTASESPLFGSVVRELAVRFLA